MPDNDELKSGKAISVEETINEINRAWREKYPDSSNEMATPFNATWIIQTYDTYVIVSSDNKYYRVAYSSGGNGITFADKSDWVEVKERREWVDVLKALKSGNRNNAQDRARIREARQHAREIDRLTKELEPDDTDAPEEYGLQVEKALVNFGGEIKATRTDDGVKVGGYLIRFTGEDDPDLAGEYFTKDTDLGMEFPNTAPVYFHHGLDPKIGRKRLGRASVRQDEFGVWAETILQERDQYEKFIAELALAGKLGWSSGTAGHILDKEQGGKATRITAWPIAEASLTHTPAEPRNVVALKSLINPTTAGEAEAEQSAPIEAVIEPVSQTVVPEGTENPMEGNKTMENELIEGLTERLDRIENALKSLPATQPAVSVTKDEADKQPVDPGKFIKAVASMYKGEGVESASSYIKASGINEAVPAEGGILLPQSIQAGILQKMYADGQLLSRVQMDTVSSNNMSFLQVLENSRADGYRQGGLLGYWLAEAGTLTKSIPKFEKVRLETKKLGVLTYATDEQLEDTPFIASWLGREVPKALTYLTEKAIYNGNGVGKPLGIMQSPALISVTKETGQAAATILGANIRKMWMRRLSGMSSEYVWAYNQDCEDQLFSLSQAIGTAGVLFPFIQYQNGGMTIFGRPAFSIEHAQTLGSVGDIMLMNLSQYQMISKGGIKEAQSIHLQFLTDETAFRWIYRVDGQPMDASAVTPENSSNTQGAFIAIAVRS